MSNKSFALRLYVIALVLNSFPVFLACGLGIGLDDMFQYDMLARSLASGNGFRWYAKDDLNQLAQFVNFDLSSVKGSDPARGIATSFRAPLYPTFLAVVYFFNGSGFSRFFAAQACSSRSPWHASRTIDLFRFKEIISSASSWRRIRIEIQFRRTYLCLGRCLLSHAPDLPLGLGTENPFFILLLTSFFLLLATIDKPTTPYFLLSGFFLGLTALTRSVILPFVGLAILWAWFILKQRRGAVVLLLAFALTIAPWVIRNSLLHHQLTGIETSMGYNLYLGYHPQGNGSFVFGPSLDLLTILDDAQRDKIGTQKAIEFIRAQPGRILPLAINRLGFFFGLEKRVLMYFYGNNIIGYIPLPWLLTISGILLLPFVIISISAGFGLAYLRWKPGHILLCLLFIGYILPHVLILSEDRFHLALVPYIAILAAQIWVNGFAPLDVRWYKSGLGKLIVSLALLAVFLLVINWGFELIRDADKIAQLLGPHGNQSYFPY